MTCVGLLALAIGCELKGASSTESLLGKPNSVPQDPSAGGSKPALQAKTTSSVKNKRILKGLANLYHGVGFPTGQMNERVPLKDYYFLWSLERVAMLYNLPTLADKEWYRWGAEILITNQEPSGCYPSWRYPKTSRNDETVNTAFALLFLKYSHPMKDLTPNLPFDPKELNDSIARLVPKGVTPDRSTTSPGQTRKLDR